MTPEGLIKHNICLYLDTLRRRGILEFWLNHSTGVYDQKAGRYRARNSKWDRKGVADIAGFFRGGGALYIEVKAGKGKLSEEQERFKDCCDLWGATHITAWSVDDVKRILDDLTKI